MAELDYYIQLIEELDSLDKEIPGPSGKFVISLVEKIDQYEEGKLKLSAKQIKWLDDLKERYLQ